MEIIKKPLIKRGKKNNTRIQSKNFQLSVSFKIATVLHFELFSEFLTNDEYYLF